MKSRGRGGSIEKEGSRREGIRFKYINAKPSRRERSLPLIKRKPTAEFETSKIESTFDCSMPLPLLTIKEQKSDSKLKHRRNESDPIRSIFLNAKLSRDRIPNLNTNQNLASNIHSKYLVQLLNKRKNDENSKISSSNQQHRSSTQIKDKLHESTQKDPKDKFNKLSLKSKLRVANLARNFTFTSIPTKDALFKFAKLLYNGLAGVSSSDIDQVECFPGDILLSFPKCSDILSSI